LFSSLRYVGRVDQARLRNRKQVVVVGGEALEEPQHAGVVLSGVVIRRELDLA
jgi:hypothetical protein